MQVKQEGAALRPLPSYRRPPREAGERRTRTADRGEPRCEMCGAEVIAHHCKRICLRCGFMTGCSEGI